ncbi:glycosyltransferase family 4 protein [Rhizorhabdus dicambivorans]|uniref:Glycosyl transferase family 1 n=1 Tax=Rhizorhabdus dicambivorans TaxID=1850238 RepID=A0A2A4FNL6_9SPHN|nr:glycosyltransferase family 4 protein [Rhizorhabdus dicambivorans]ATE66187.1 glycosyl transferase family 1 [Rhizorhabdus dicambivorans]PCE39747.1 glycosyl transferase family 1 [Rhizorhabdus dicambivorans]
MRKKLAIIVSHPIQHFVPFYRCLASQSDLDSCVFFASKIGLSSYFDKDMKQDVKWQMDLLSDYRKIFLPGADGINGTSFFEVNNPNTWKALREFAPDAVLIYGYSQATMVKALFWCLMHRVPALLIADSELKSDRSALAQTVKRLILPIIFKAFRAFLTVGDCNEDYYSHYGVSRRRLFRSPFTIDETLYRDVRANKAAHRSEIRRRHSIGEEEFVALCVGKVSQRKRTSDLSDALRRIKAAQGDVPLRVLCAGNGEEYERLSNEARDEKLPMSFAGFVNVDELPYYYAAADLLVHPSGRDPHPLALSEAAAVGLPLIVSDKVGAVGPTDIAREGESALVYPCGDIDALSQLMLDLSGDRQRVEAMAAASLRIFDQNDMQTSLSGLRRALDYCWSGALSATDRSERP